MNHRSASLPIMNNYGFVNLLAIMVAEAVIFTMIYWLSPIHNQLLKVNKSNKQFEVAQIIGEEFGALVSQSYYNAFNQYPRPADSKVLCEGGEFLGVVTPRRGSLYRMVHADSSGDYAFLCLPDTGFVIKHPLAPNKLIMIGELSATGVSYKDWLRLVRDPLRLVHNTRYEKSSFASFLVRGLLAPSFAQDVANFNSVATTKSSISPISSSAVLYEEMSPLLPDSASIANSLIQPVESVNCGANKSHHCIAYRFCTRANQDVLPCRDEEYVWQTVALPKLPKTTVNTCGGISL